MDKLDYIANSIDIDDAMTSEQQNIVKEKRLLQCIVRRLTLAMELSM